MAGPLEGLLVVSIDQAVAAPFASCRLADAGARVIKVERPGGDFARRYDSAANGISAYFAWLNRGKESIELDIKDAGDAALLHKMVAQADVFIQNLAPGAAGRAGFSCDELRAKNSKLITCDISGYGDDGPYAGMKAYDLLIQSETGLASITGSPDAPGRVGVSIADIAAGMYAFNAITLALIDRQKSGKGQAISVSLFDAMADWMTVPLLFQDYLGKPPSRVGLHHPGIAPYGCYTMSDGKDIVIAIQNEREWARFCEEILGDAALAVDARFASNQARVNNREQLNILINNVFSAITGEHIAQRLRQGAIGFGAVNSVADLSAHPQLRRIAVHSVVGEIEMPAPPAKSSRHTFEGAQVPAVGADSARIRAEFANEVEEKAR